jgi:alkanesulfonate monooxygenase SsuD/methylene tetrahydromethanopterin reductase-like flavin-dependent oxidoreductase (luciferase family)
MTLPHVAAWNSWYSDFDNDPGQVAALVATIDRACAEAGRAPDEVEKTVAVYIGLDSAPTRRSGGSPLQGSADDIAAQLRRIEAAGVSHIQAVLDPIVPESVERLGDIAARVRSNN